ncbi:twin transmembrane helix small protein [Polaromonas sp. YR568]|uniref:twin transmembrane helix small protein n=1 Tax=Polaromonas sp. YR568 TaxID=1855301 RepID=UPI00398BD9D2
MTYLVALAFIAILASLASALFFMLKGGKENEGSSKRKTSNMARALAFRVGFSVLLFICILIAWKLGYIQPTGIPAGK